MTIDAYSILDDTIVEIGAIVHSHSHCKGAQIGPSSTVGPFARLREGTMIGVKAKVGNFVEIKKTSLGDGAKASHLTYLGDAQVGARANVGAGTITCNYDGYNKHRTTIGEGVFIGSNTSLVAPVDIGEGALIGAGSTITKMLTKMPLALKEQSKKICPMLLCVFERKRLLKINSEI